MASANQQTASAGSKASEQGDTPPVSSEMQRAFAAILKDKFPEGAGLRLKGVVITVEKAEFKSKKDQVDWERLNAQISDGSNMFVYSAMRRKSDPEPLPTVDAFSAVSIVVESAERNGRTITVMGPISRA